MCVILLKEIKSLDKCRHLKNTQLTSNLWSKSGEFLSSDIKKRPWIRLFSYLGVALVLHW
jgi:hypothetical protein